MKKIDALCHAFNSKAPLAPRAKGLEQWLEQAEDDAKVSKKKFLLLMKFNNIGSYVCSENLRTYDGDATLEVHMENFMWYKGKYLIYTLEEFLMRKESIDLLTYWKQNINN